jgi:homoserine dehydrogenase
MSGTPLLNVCEGGLAGAGVTGVRGILNGTCNFILSRMEDGADYDDALREAQELGYAETDPAGDVEGWDAAAKVAILGNLVLGGSLTLADVAREGIDNVSRDDVDRAVASGRRLRLVGSVSTRDGSVVDPRVGVEELELDDPLAAVRGADNLLTFDTEALGAVSIGGPGAGKAATGHALIADLVSIHRTSSP